LVQKSESSKIVSLPTGESLWEVQVTQWKSRMAHIAMLESGVPFEKAEHKCESSFSHS